MGVMRAERNALAGSLEWMQKAAKYQREALKQEPESEQAKQKLAHVLLMAINLQVELKQFPEASTAAKELEPLLLEMKSGKGTDLFRLARLVARD